MNSPAPRRYTLLFLALVLAGASFDIYSKHVVFTDLGYPGGLNTLVDGQHERFASPPNAEGQSVLYSDSWLVFQLYTNFNMGALWGIGQEFTWVFASLSVFAVVGILVWAFCFNGINSIWLTFSLGLILAGTIGNLWDRTAMHGCVDAAGNTIYGVRDFLFFRFGGREGYPWPIFNFADAFLVTGAIMMFLHSMFVPIPEKESAPTETASQDTAQAATAT